MTLRSPFPDVQIPDVSLPELILGRAAERGDKPALVDAASGRTVTYSDLVTGARLMAGGLTDRGFGKGDVFAIFMPNVPEYAVAFHGVALVGGTVTTISPLYTTEELAFQLNDAGAKFLLTIPQFLDRALEAAGQSAVKEVFVLGDAAEGASSVMDLLGTSTEPPKVEFDLDNDLIALPYSSGTTGLPKGVMLTHRNIVANVKQAEAPLDVSEDDVIIGVLPFFHIYGMTVIMNIALYVGATVVTMPRFELEPFLQALQDYKVTRAYLVPPIVLALAKHPAVDDYDLSNLQVITSGAAPLGPELSEACAKRLDCLVIQGYGLTETSPVTHTTPDKADKNRPGSIGFLIPNTECKFVDVESGEELGPNQDGELWIRGPQVMKGYLNNEDATRHTIDSDGWLHTGDIGHVDEDGYFFLVDRVKELIKYKGFQVAPAELEAILVSHPEIADAAVVPAAEEEAGEIPKAYVVTKNGVSEEDIISYVAERVAPHKKIRQVEFIDEIPKSPSGKILRRVLIDKERAKS